MNPTESDDRLRRADEIFDRALEVAEEDRTAFIRDECGDQPGLFEEVMALAEAAASAEGYFERRAETLLGRVWEQLDTVDGPAGPAGLENQRLGPYELEARIARGGMGSVYRARRGDGRFDFSVALKVLRRGLDTDDVIRRFTAERQILAGLEHPNVARIFDAGETPDGRPYLVMELVDGRPILEYCEARAASLDTRLDLFAEACEAVAYAHRHQVVHRDIKSTNILVADEQLADATRPVVKLLDFGIAKVLDPEAEVDSHGLTRTGVRMLTPRYASPEQVDARPITAASDVYQLGVLLYELLSGQSPYVDRDGEPLQGRELEEAILSRDPPPPSRRALTTGLTDTGVGQIRADLDAIVLKAMRKEPEDRYESVLALAADLSAYRRGLPVSAAVGSRSYRIRKFVRRHRAAVAAAAAGVLLLAGWAVTATLQNRALAVERDRVLAEAARTGAIRDYLVGMFEVSDPFQPDPTAGDSTSARELLDAGARRLATDLADKPLVRAELAFTIGRTYRSLSLDEPSRQLLQEALELQSSTLGPDSPEVAQTLYELGMLFRRVDVDSAATLLDRALAVGEVAFGPDDPFVAQVLTQLGQHLAFTANPDTVRSRELRERAVTILRSHPDASRAQLADALTISVYGRNDEMDLVIERMTEALGIRRELYGDAHPYVAASLNDLSIALEAAGHPVRADSMMEAAFDIYLATLGESHGTTLDVMGNMASHYRDIRKDYQAAEALYERNIALVREHRPEDRLARAYPLYGLAVTLMKVDRFDEAEPKLRETHDLLVQEVGWANGLSFTTRTTLGECLRRLGRLADAAAVLESSRAGFDDAPSIRTAHKLATLRELKRVYEAQSRPDRAHAMDEEIEELAGT